jgi:hypothetical protein
MPEQTLDRREFLRRAAILGVAASGAGWLGIACKSGGSGGQTEELSCADVSGLDDVERETRTSLNYVERSVTTGQACQNCGQFTAADGDRCGTCAAVPGPINPRGNCASWTAAT